MPTGETFGVAQVNVLLILQYRPVEVAIAVVAKSRSERGIQAQATGGDRLVGHAAGARSHAVAEDLGAFLR